MRRPWNLEDGTVVRAKREIVGYQWRPGEPEKSPWRFTVHPGHIGTVVGWDDGPVIVFPPLLLDVAVPWDAVEYI